MRTGVSSKMIYPVRDPELRMYVIHCMVKRSSTKESLAYLKGYGYKINERTLRRIKKDIKESRFKRVKDIFDFELIDQHINAIDLLLESIHQMWLNYERETDPYKKVEINIQIINILPLLSQYYYETRKIVEKVNPKELVDNRDTTT